MTHFIVCNMMMKFTISLLFAVSLVTGDEIIVRSERTAMHGQFPYVVYVHVKTSNGQEHNSCTGSILTPRSILTAG